MNTKQEKVLQFFNELRIFRSIGNLGNLNRLKDYNNYLFHGISFGGKDILDIGSGYGIYTGFMAAGGAKSIVSVEPELDGGTQKMLATIQKIKEKFDLDSISIVKEIFQKFESDSKFDLILMHNCINHLNEEMCIILGEDEAARNLYISYFEKLKLLLKEDGKLIITDSTRSNLFASFGLPNPFAPSIEYLKHQDPNLWIDLANEAGLKLHSRDLGKIYLFGTQIAKLIPRRLACYFFGSTFKLVFHQK